MLTARPPTASCTSARIATTRVISLRSAARRLADRRVSRGARARRVRPAASPTRATRSSAGRDDDVACASRSAGRSVPHPDDIEIGIGGLVAKHVALGHQVGLCDLTAGEMGSNGTVTERLAEAEAARDVLGAAWRINLRLPDRALGSRRRSHARDRRPRAPRAAARRSPCRTGRDRHPDHVAASQLLTEAIFSAGLRRIDADGEAWKPESVCYYFINDSAPPSFVVDVSDHYETKRRALACSRQPVPSDAAGCGCHAADVDELHAADREPRRAVRRARRRGVRGRLRRETPCATAAPPSRRDSSARTSASSATPRSAAAASWPPSWARRWRCAGIRCTSSARKRRSGSESFRPACPSTRC